jgi:hypothetical protein
MCGIGFELVILFWLIEKLPITFYHAYRLMWRNYFRCERGSNLNHWNFWNSARDRKSGIGHVGVGTFRNGRKKRSFVLANY